MKKHLLFLFAFVFMTFSAVAEMKTIQILYTSDEHGYIERSGENGGAAEMYQKWLLEDSIKTIPTLILSGGDNNTGPVISAITKGKATVEVMKAMGYHCDVIGNHEIDFGQDAFIEQCKIRNFPTLSANLQVLKSCKIPSKYIQPYYETEINGLKILIIGLTTFDFPSLTMPANINGMRIANYLDAITPYKDKIKNADVAILLSHACIDEIQELYTRHIKDWGIDLFCNAHCHTCESNLINNIPFVQGDPFLNGYHKLVLNHDSNNGLITFSHIEHKINNYTWKNPQIDSIITQWKQSTSDQILEVIGYADFDIAVDNPGLINMMLYSWLHKFPSASVCLMNRGGVRQGIPKGDITVGTLMGILPFENQLYLIKMRGKDIKAVITNSNPYVAGVDVKSDFKLDAGGMLDDTTYYQVLVNDFIYEGGDYFELKDNSILLKETGINIRIPFEDHIRKLRSSWNHPINQYLDMRARYK